MKIQEILTAYSKKIPISELRILLCFYLEITLEKLLISEDYILDNHKIYDLKNLFNRRLDDEPIAYITSQKEFYSRIFYVDKNVLIPRSDTELIIDLAKKYLSNKSENLKILDLCAGSGCIGVTLSFELDSHVLCSDISNLALDVIDKNIKKLSASNIDCVKSDYFHSLDKSNKYDLIVCNPPYISLDEKNIMAKETLRYEPEIALFGDDNGLYPYKILSDNSHMFLEKNGYLIVEIGIGKSDIIKDILSTNLTFIEIVKDLSGIDRSMVFKK